MRVEFEITYDAGKLAKEMKSIIKDFMSNSAVAFEKGSKEAIEKGNFDKIKKSTRMVRRLGYSPNANLKKTGSSKPLRHTDRLLKSIKAFPKSQTLRFNEYGKHHLGKGVVFVTGDTDMDEIKETSGIAYTTKSNKFTNYVLNKTGSDLAGRPVPTRFWLQMDKNLEKKSLARFEKLIKKNFIRKSPLSFSRFAR